MIEKSALYTYLYHQLNDHGKVDWSTQEWLQFTYFGKVVPKGRPKFNTKTGRAYTPAATQQFEKSVKEWMQAEISRRNLHSSLPAKYPIELVLVLYSKVPTVGVAQDLFTSGILPPVNFDGDNAAKAIMDALNGVAWKDDRQVARLVVEKKFADVPGFNMMLRRRGLEHYEALDFDKLRRVKDGQ